MTFGIIRANLNQMSGHFADRFVEHYERAEARMTAMAAAHMALATLSDSASWRAGYASVSIGGGTGWATLEDNATDTSLSVGEVRIKAGGGSGSAVDTVIALAVVPTVPPAVKGGITANTTVKTLGNMVITVVCCHRQ